MEAQLIPELTRICQAVSIESPTEFSFAGRRAPELNPTKQQLQMLAPTQNLSIQRLQYLLYLYCYCQRFTGTLPDEPTPQGSPDSLLLDPSNSLLQELSDANTSRERWDSGWQIYRIEPSGQIIAHKYGTTRRLWPGQFLIQDGHGIAPRVGANISVFFPKESRTVQPGFYFVFGETVTDQEDDYNLVRFYWNIKEAGATTLIRWLTQAFNRFFVPFRLKCWTNWTLFYRADAAVLYVNKRFYQIAATLIADAYPQLQEYLKPDTPLFTKPLAPGLGLAEDPENGESFGSNCCRLIAEGIWNAYTQGLQTEQARLEEVVKQFGQHGITLARPYLSPGSIDQYAFPNVCG
jgi:hypothetical protein